MLSDQDQVFEVDHMLAGWELTYIQGGSLPTMLLSFTAQLQFSRNPNQPTADHIYIYIYIYKDVWLREGFTEKPYSS